MSLQGSTDARGLPRIRLTIRGPFGSAGIDAVIDTGFTAALSLPSHMVLRLGLPRRGIRPTILADGSLKALRVCLVDVDWMGATVPAEAYEGGPPEASIGAGLLRGHRLLIDYGPLQSVEATTS